MEFSGFFFTSNEALFSITDTEGKRSPGWLKVGQSFEGYTVVSFDREHEVISLKQGDRTLKVPLRTSKVKNGKATIQGTITLLNEQVEGVQASLFLGEEAVFPLKDGVTLRITAKPLPDGSILYRSRFDVREKDGTEKKISAPGMVALPGQSFSMQSGDYGYSFKP